MATRPIKKHSNNKGRRPAPKRPVKKPGRKAGRKGPGKLGRIFLPAFLSLTILGCIGFLAAMGYQTVTASDFFDVKRTMVAGTDRASSEDIQRIVNLETSKSGSWNADLPLLKARIERLPFVKTASVSRVLPNDIRVSVVERSPVAIVRTSSGDFLVDSDAVMIAPALREEPQIPVPLKGWDEGKTEKAAKENVERVRLFQKMLDEWKQFELTKRVREVDLSDPRDPLVTVDESGAKVAVALANDNLAGSLKVALEAIAGKGDKVKAVNAVGAYPVIEYISK